MILGLAFVFIASLAVSTNRSGVRYRYLIQIFIVQIIIAFFFLDSKIGLMTVQVINDGFNLLMDYAADGVSFVFGKQAGESQIFFFSVLMPIVFISALIGILKYLRILPLIVKVLGYLLSKVNGMPRLESFNAVSSLTFGQSENFILYKNVLGRLPKHRLYTMAATAMSTVSLAIVGAYMELIDAKYVCVALALNMFSTFFVLSILNPYELTEQEKLAPVSNDIGATDSNFFQVLSDYILDGFKVAIIVGAMLIGFTALLALLNGIFNAVLGVSFQYCLGILFYPLAWLMGLSAGDTLQGAMIMATKLVSNEFIAMQQLTDGSVHLSAHSQAIVSVFLVSFANFTSIGILSGAVRALNEEAGRSVAQFGIKMLYGATLVSMMSAIIVGMFV